MPAHQTVEGWMSDIGEVEEQSDRGSRRIISTVLIGYYDYLGTRPKKSHRPIIGTGR